MSNTNPFEPELFGGRDSAASKLQFTNYARPNLSQRNSVASSMRSNLSTGQDRYDVMVKYINRKAAQSKWMETGDFDFNLTEPGASSNLGVMLKRPDGVYTAEPMFLSNDLVKAVEKMALPVAFTMSSEIVFALLQQIAPLQRELPLDPHGCVLPIVNSVKDLAVGRPAIPREAYMCLCKQEGYVLLWSDSVQGILAHAADVETRLMGLVWGAPMTPAAAHQSAQISNRQSYFPTDTHASNGWTTPRDALTNEKMNVIQTALDAEDEGDRAFDPEKDGAAPPPRPFLLTHAWVIGLAMVLVVVVESACLAKLLQEVRYDGSYTRFALIATIPLFASFSLFFMIVITGSIFQLFGPLSSVKSNSLYYSGKAPKPGRYPDLELPHITIQMPVYKEGLKGVIIPTVTSLLAAVRHYEERGGTASIFVNDDGMQLVKPELAEARKAYYELNNIGWCSRPAHCTTEGDRYFLRKGQFKKASNMNYCLDFSIRVEDQFLKYIEEICRARGCTQEDLSIEDENEIYERAKDLIIQNDGGRTWAAGDVRIGEIILIIDSDTRVPEDCLLYGALEMYESPEVALLQHGSGIMQVSHSVFENGISYFTNLIYTSIQFAVGNGDCAPFVGHNTFIRWKAIQSISFEEDGQTKFWSDSHVSEDFDVSLRLQMSNFVVRLATYHNGGFEEGVSLTVYDELARWEKYAYGCNELVFHPLIRWPTKGPITPLFWRFLFSNIKITSKVTICAYIGTYYAIASAIPLTLVNYLIVGWFDTNVDQFYIASWKIFVGMAVVFNILSPLAYAMLRHRLGQTTFFWSVLETLKWTPMFLLFFGGISYHLLKAIICHFLSIPMEWTTTAKEVEAGGFRIGLDRVVRDFKWMYCFLLPIIGGMIYLAQFAPRGWIISDFAAIVPIANQVGCHALLPFALGLF